MKRELEIRKVLIVDDEPELRDILLRMMHSLNLEAEVAENGEVALSMLKTSYYHTALCDIMMPEMTGLECLANAQVAGVITPFVFITGYDDSNRMLQAIRLGALDFIAKPFDNHEVTDVVFRALEVGTRRRQIAKALRETDPELSKSIEKDDKMISLMRARNNIKRTA